MSKLEHAGVKGMHWGVRRDTNRPGGADGIPDKGEKKRGKLGKHLDSLKRERSWNKALKEVHNMSAKDIKIVASRISLENNFKALSRGKMGTKKDKTDYLRRHEMSDQELARKIALIQAKESLHKAVRNASKEQREIGIKIAQTASTIGVKYALNGRPALKGIPKDILDAFQEPTIKTQQDAYDSGIKIVDSRSSNPKVKAMLNLAKDVKVDKFKRRKEKK
jgi:hypothetical protein